MKKNIMHFITLKQLRNFVGNNRVIRQFADRHDLVYFGAMSQDDESRLVKGLTVSNTNSDSHYCVGTVFGRDVIFLQRSDTLLPSMGRHHKEHYTWNILELDLAGSAHLPHMYVEGKYRHNTGFYEALSMKRREFSTLPDHFLQGYDKLFGRHFTLRMSGATSVEFNHIVPPEVAAVMAHHFHAFDYEWQDDTLYVYYLSRQPSLDKLDLMLNAGLWLAGELDARAQQLESTSG